MIKQNKTKLLFILGTIFVVSIAMAACNSKESEKTVTIDSAAMQVKKDSMNVIDTLLLDSGKVKPTPDGN